MDDKKLRAICRACLVTSMLPLEDVKLDGQRVMFVCPACGARGGCAVERGVADALTEHGVLRLHPERPRPGPPITYDDLLAFHEALEASQPKLAPVAIAEALR